MFVPQSKQEPMSNKQIIDLLKKAGFKKTERCSYSNLYCCVCLDYQKKGETVIVNNYGGIMEQLPTNYFAILGWLLVRGMVSLTFVEKIKSLEYEQ